MLFDQDTIKQIQAIAFDAYKTTGRIAALLDGGRIDWRMVDGELRVHREFLESLRIYPKEAPGLVHEAVDNAERDAVLARMEREGSLTARITLKASIRALVPVAGQEVQAWLPLPAACPQQSNIELLDCTPGGVAAPEYAPQRTCLLYTSPSPRDS